ncbi:hypothetical protein KO465_03995 [Candidatus Micrarchaeota archaeon]|nr:hypothetical protein [Candidatus Micrarchaeota archaeon]
MAKKEVKKEDDWEEIVVKEPLQIKKGYMYFVDKKGFVFEGIPGSPTPPTKLKIPSILRAPGYIYYVNLKGYICRRKPLGKI